MILRTTIGAFVTDTATAAAVESLKENHLFLRSTIVVQQGGLDAAITYLADHATPPVLLVETTAHGQDMFDKLARLAEVCAPEAKVFLIGRDNDIEIYRNLMREGIADYLLGPVDAEHLVQSLKDALGGKGGNAGRVIAFAGARGGVGSSIVAHHTAFALSQIYGEQVIVVDLDIPYGTASLVFNIQARQSIAEALTQTQRMDETLLERYLLPYDPSEGKLTVLASPASLAAGVAITSENLEVLLGYVSGMAGFVVVDLPHVWEQWCRDVLVGCDELVLVAEPDLASLRDSKNLVEFLGANRGEGAPTRIVLNQVGAAKKAELTEKEFRDALGMGVEVQIPSDPAAFGGALNNGELIFKTAAKSKACEAINALARKVSARAEEAEGEKKKGFSFFKKKK